MTFNTSARTVQLLDAVASDATDLVGVVTRDEFIYNTLYITNADAATVKVFVSADGSNWIQHGSDITATSAVVNMPAGAFPYIKVTRDAVTGTGTVSVKIASGNGMPNA